MELGSLRFFVSVLGENLHSFCSWSRKYSKDGAPRRRGVFLAYRMRRIEEGFVRPQIQHGVNCVLLVSRKLCSCSSRRGEEGVKKVGCMVAGSCMVGAEESRGPAASYLHRFRLLLDLGEGHIFVALLSPLVEYCSFEKEI